MNLYWLVFIASSIIIFPLSLRVGHLIRLEDTYFLRFREEDRERYKYSAFILFGRYNDFIDREVFLRNGLTEENWNEALANRRKLQRLMAITLPLILVAGFCLFAVLPI